MVALHITPVCSHRCGFCYFADSSVKPKHPPLDQLLKVVSALATSGVKELALLGGDPGAYPHALEVAKHAAERGLRVSILSNTLRFPGSSIEKASEYISAFEATIHHVEPDRHDAFCHAKGAYAFVTARLRRAAELGRVTGIAVNVIPETAHELFDLVSRVVEVERVPLEYIVLQRIVPFGRAAESPDFTLTRSLAEQALREIRKVDERLGIKISVEDPFPLCILPGDAAKYMVPCAWGFTKAAVNANGDLSRCGADPRYRLGNILQTPLLEIWNNSEILRSFRSREYLPGRCQTCPDMEKCGGGCPLSCEIEKDHGVDYLFLEYEKLDEEIHGDISFGRAAEDELSSILQIEWSNFQGYGHIFTVESLKRWYRVSPDSFWVVRDSRHWVLGYAAIVPVSEQLFRAIVSGQISSLAEFPESDVLSEGETDYFHIEVLATVPSRTASRAGRYLINAVGGYLLEHARYVSASPITDIGRRLCGYFDFEYVGVERVGEVEYPIYTLTLDEQAIGPKLRRF